MPMRKPFPKTLRAQRLILRGGARSYLLLGGLTTAQQNELPQKEGLLVNNASIKQINAFINEAWGGIGAEGGGGIGSLPGPGQSEVVDIVALEDGQILVTYQETP